MTEQRERYTTERADEIGRELSCADPAAQLDEANTLVLRLSDALNEMRRERDALRAELDGARSDNLQLQSRLQDARRQCRGFRAELETHEELKAELHAENEQLVRQLNESRDEAQRLRRLVDTHDDRRARWEALLRDVAEWTALDGNGISQPLLDRVLIEIGLEPLDGDGVELESARWPWKRRKLEPPPEIFKLLLTPGEISAFYRHPIFMEFCKDVIEVFDDVGGPNFFDVTVWHPERGAFDIRIERKRGKSPGQVVAELKALLRDVLSGRNLDGDGISDPLRARIREAVGRDDV